MSENNDGHSPYTCNYRNCGAVLGSAPCPFTVDEHKKPVESKCEHSWRQYWTETPRSWPNGFYCTKCLDKHG